VSVEENSGSYDISQIRPRSSILTCAIKAQTPQSCPIHITPAVIIVIIVISTTPDTSIVVALVWKRLEWTIIASNTIRGLEPKRSARNEGKRSTILAEMMGL
jgi:hypothetical protein